MPVAGAHLFLRHRKDTRIMPLAKIAIEQTAQDGWVAELEAGGVLARAARLRAPSLAALLDQVRATYDTLVGPSSAAETGPAQGSQRRERLTLSAKRA
jgi:hypothetical protein